MNLKWMGRCEFIAARFADLIASWPSQSVELQSPCTTKSTQTDIVFCQNERATTKVLPCFW